MNPYDIYFTNTSTAQLADLRRRADSAGRRDEFESRYEEIFRVISDPRGAFQVGHSLGQTNLPGGFYREWQWHFLYVQYAIFPDAERGWIYHIECFTGLGLTSPSPA